MKQRVRKERLRLRKQGKKDRPRGLKPALLRPVPVIHGPPVSGGNFDHYTVANGARDGYSGAVAKKPISIEDIPLGKLKPTPEHIALLRAAIAGIESQRDLYIGALRSLEKAAGIVTTEPQVMRLPARKEKFPYPEEETKPLALRSGSWADSIYSVLIEANRPVPPDQVKLALAKMGFADRLKEAGHSFYATVQRLKQGGHVVEHNGALTTPTIKKSFLEAVAAGVATDIRHVRYRNLICEEIYRFLQDKKGPASLLEIMEHLNPMKELANARLQKPYVLKMLQKLISQSKSVKRPSKGMYVAVEYMTNAEQGTETSDETLFGTAEAKAPAVH